MNISNKIINNVLGTRKRQDTQVYLSKVKFKENQGIPNAYIYPKNIKKKKIFLTERTPNDINNLSRTLGHEEVHYAIAEVKGWKASRQYDDIRDNFLANRAFVRGEILDKLSREIYGKGLIDVQYDKNKMKYLDKIARQRYEEYRLEDPDLY